MGAISANSIALDPLVALALDGLVGGDKICPLWCVLRRYLILWPQSSCRMKPDDLCSQFGTILVAHVLQSSYPFETIALRDTLQGEPMPPYWVMQFTYPWQTLSFQ